MTTTEQLLKAALAENADSAPTAVDIGAGVRRRRQRARRLQATVSTFVVVALAATGTTIALSHRAVSIVGAGVFPLPPAISRPPGWSVLARTMSFHGLEIDVPASWPINNFACGKVQGNTVINEPDPQIKCVFTSDVYDPPLDHVHLFSQPFLLTHPKTAENLHGLPAEIVHVPVRVPTGDIRHDIRLRTRVYLPSLQTSVVVVAEARLTRLIIDSIRPAATSPEGCPMKSFAGRGDPSELPPSSNEPLVPDPAAVTSIAICNYDNIELQSSTAVPAENRQHLLDQLNALTIFREPYGEICGPTNETDVLTLHITYADQPERTAVIGNLAACNALVAQAGTVYRAVAPSLTRSLGNLTHIELFEAASSIIFRKHASR